jgi:hypothetical protein
MPKTNSVESRIRDMISNQRDAVVRSRPMTLDSHADDEPMVLDMDPSEVPPSQTHTAQGRNAVLGEMTQQSPNMLPRPPRQFDGHDVFADINSDPYLNNSWNDVRQGEARQSKFITGQIRTNPAWRQFRERPNRS